jgi:hypothetical protein
MNPKTLVAVTALSSTIAVASAVQTFAQKKRVKELEKALIRKDAVTEVWKRNFERASELLTPNQLIELMKKQSTDRKFEKIIIDNI